jgi:heme/copper-type cytochrome/quinol oxidase subunit 3
VAKNYAPFIEHDRNPILRITCFSSGLLVDPCNFPLLNTCLLLTSGSFFTASSRRLCQERFTACKFYLLCSISLGFFFFIIQICEYLKTGFSINDGIYGSLFFMLTGIHGIHVIVGLIFLIVCLIRLFYSHFTGSSHYAFEAAGWY